MKIIAKSARQIPARSYLALSLALLLFAFRAYAYDGQPKANTLLSNEDIIYLEQGWNDRLRELFYYTPQGSHLIPYRWLQVLERSENSQRFASPANLARYGWITETQRSALNPGGFPIGFALEPVEVPGTGKWVGLTCAGCHTNDVTVNGKTVRIDGAPAASIDLDNFFTDLATAVQGTLFDKAKYQRFSNNILGAKPSPGQAKQLEAELIKFATTFAGQMALRTPPIHPGPGRVDALGQIINSLSVFDLEQPDNWRPPTAPVSYPFLWLAPKLAWVQWDPISSNPLARNAGEVMGVFGQVNFTGGEKEIRRIQAETELREKFQRSALDLIPPKWREQIAIPLNDKVNRDKAKLDKMLGHDKGMFASTVLYKNLYNLEKWLMDLKQPPWREDLFGPVDLAVARKGQALFNRDCLNCHNMPPFEMTPKEENIIGKQFIKIARVNYKQVGTDSTYIENLLHRYTKTGDLGPVLFENQAIVPTGGFFLGSVGATVKKGLETLGLSTKEKLEYSDYRFYPPVSPGQTPKPYQPSSIDVLKGGPLLGIWATAPFLHNGSVPNLYELLLPPSSRSKVFWVGSRELDTKKLGFVSTEQPELFRFDTGVKGNGNGGHAYPLIPYSEEERMAVIEYLKDPMRVINSKVEL